MKMSNRLFHRTSVIWICCLLLLTGCAARIPNSKYELLQESTSSLLTTTENTYARIEKLQRRFAVTTAAGAEINRNSFKPLIAGQSYDLTPELRFREAALEVLVDYVNVLCAFSTKDYLKNVDKATLRLGAGLRDLFRSSQLLTTPEDFRVTGIFASLINKMTREIVKQEKRVALKQAMDLAQNDIEELSKLIEKSNSKIKMSIGVMLAPLINHANEVRPPVKTLERIPFDMEVAEVIAEAEAIEASLESINAAMTKIPLAHKEIRNDLDRIQSAFDSLQELAREVRRSQKYYRSLKD